MIRPRNGADEASRSDRSNPIRSPPVFCADLGSRSGLRPAIAEGDMLKGAPVPGSGVFLPESAGPA